MVFSLPFLIVFLISGAFASVAAKKLTPLAALVGASLGLVLYWGAGWSGIIFMAAFFLLGTLATAWKRKTKEALGIAEAYKGRRTASQVLANAGVPAAIALIAVFFPQKPVLYNILVAAAFSSATADTLSSELGSLYGKKFYNILSLQKDQRGLDGVISLEGTLLGIAGSTFIALLFLLLVKCSVSAFIIVIIAGTIGNLTDSYLGAALERKGRIKNDMVNFLNTLLAVLAAFLLQQFV